MASYAHHNNPPTEEELNKLYEDVRRGYQRDLRSTTLDDVRISMGADDLGAFIDQYSREEPISADPPSYEPARQSGGVSSPALPEKGVY